MQPNEQNKIRDERNSIEYRHSHTHTQTHFISLLCINDYTCIKLYRLVSYVVVSHGIIILHGLCVLQRANRGQTCVCVSAIHHYDVSRNSNGFEWLKYKMSKHPHQSLIHTDDNFCRPSEKKMYDSDHVCDTEYQMYGIMLELQMLWLEGT